MKDYLQVGDTVEAYGVTGILMVIIATDAGPWYRIALEKPGSTYYTKQLERAASTAFVRFMDNYMLVMFGGASFVAAATPEEMMTHSHPDVRKLGKKLARHRARWRWWYESKWYLRWMNIWKHV